MHYPDSADPAVALAAARPLWKKAAIRVALFGAGVNLLMLTTPLYMLQVYDRVTTTRKCRYAGGADRDRRARLGGAGRV